MWVVWEQEPARGGARGPRMGSVGAGASPRRREGPEDGQCGSRSQPEEARGA